MRIGLPPDPTAASLARQAVKEVCAEVAVDLDSLLLCASELVTNALLHGVPPVELEVLVRDARVRVAVHDAGVGPVERRRNVRADTLSGRGLGIVEMLAAGWGADATATGKVIWFEISTRQ